MSGIGMCSFTVTTASTRVLPMIEIDSTWTRDSRFVGESNTKKNSPSLAKAVGVWSMTGVDVAGGVEVGVTVGVGVGVGMGVGMGVGVGIDVGIGKGMGTGVGVELQATVVTTPSIRAEMIRALEREIASLWRSRMFFTCTLKQFDFVQYKFNNIITVGIHI